MALFDLNRSNDTPIATLQVASITPVNWHKFPPAIQPSNPIYVPVVSFAGGAVGDDVDTADAASTDTYSPRNQAQKATLLGTTLAVDIGRARGYLEPDDPYSTPVPAAPVITSLAPNTAVAGTDPNLVVTITGTGFTPWSTVLSGNFPIPVRYISPTKLEILQKPKASVAGTVQVVVIDHGVKSAPSNFVFT
jgi:hypothetical protein